MANELESYQRSLLVRLSYLCVRTIQTRDRHFAAAEKFKKTKSRLQYSLITISAILTVGLISIISGEQLKIILNNEKLYLAINYSALILSTLLVLSSIIIEVTLIYLDLDEKIIKHELAGQDYTRLRDEVISLAGKVRYQFNKGLEHEVEKFEEGANALARSSPTIPKDVHKEELDRERKRKDNHKKETPQVNLNKTDPLYWIKRFSDIELSGEIELLKNKSSQKEQEKES